MVLDGTGVWQLLVFRRSVVCVPHAPFVLVCLPCSTLEMSVIGFWGTTGMIVLGSW